jgi:uncharacterized protein YjiS (DUF1127 family)
MSSARNFPDRAQHSDLPTPANSNFRERGDALRPSSGRVYWLRSPAIVMRGWRPRAIERTKQAWLWRHLSTIVGAVFARIRQWEERERSRQFLLALDDHGLRDLGLSRLDAWREANKPFWRK